MRAALLLTAALLATPALAQAPAAPPAPVVIQEFVTAAEVQAMIAASRAKRTNEANILTPLIRSGPWRPNLEYRAAGAGAAIHDKDTELFYVIEGAATLVTGGKLVSPTRNGDNQNGPSIEGGVTRKVAKGDWLWVPAGSPHQVAAVEGAVSLMTFHVPLAWEGHTQPPPNKEFTAAAEVSAMAGESHAKRKDEPQINTPLVVSSPWKVQVEYRGSAGPAAVHETESEMMYVIDGAATVVTGGKLTGDRRTNPENLTGAGIESGIARPFGKGDWLFIPAGSPHQIAAVTGSVTLGTIHVPKVWPGK